MEPGVRRAIGRIAGVLAAALACLPVFGCVSVRPIEVGESAQLASDEGILVVHLETELPISKLEFGRGIARLDLPAGEHLLLLAVPAGGYRWSRVAFPAGEGDVTFSWRRDDRLRFRVEPGRLGYAGSFEFHGSSGERSVTAGGRSRNRAAYVLRQLRERFPALLRAHPPLYTGRAARDDFLHYYGRTFLGTDAAPAGVSAPR